MVPTPVASAEGEVAPEAGASPGASPTLAGEEELILIAKIRARFADEFAERERTGRLFPAFFGDSALLRVLRQHRQDVTKACEWFENFLVEFRDFDGDRIVPTLADLLERIQSEGRSIQSSDIPGHSAIKEMCTVLYTADERTAAGDPVSYIPVAELNKAGIVQAGFEHYERFVIHGWVLRALELEDLTRREGRLCWLFNVIDVHGCGLSHLACREFDKQAERMMLRLERLVPDLTGENWVVNAPWFVYKLFPWAKKVLRTKVDNWFLSGQEPDPELLRHLSAEQLARLQSTRRAGTAEAADSGDLSIGRGKLLERVVQVAPGQCVSWRFQVALGSASLRPPELDFCVVAIWDDEAAEAGANGAAAVAAASAARRRGGGGGVQLEDSGLVDLVGSNSDDEDDEQGARLPEHTVVESVRFKANEGEISGHYVAPKAGVLSLRWDNSFSWLRAKALRLDIDEGAITADTAEAKEEAAPE